MRIASNNVSKAWSPSSTGTQRRSTNTEYDPPGLLLQVGLSSPNKRSDHRQRRLQAMACSSGRVSRRGSQVGAGTPEPLRAVAGETQVTCLTCTMCVCVTHAMQQHKPPKKKTSRHYFCAQRMPTALAVFGSRRSHVLYREV
jgi:hypothetical protein